MKISNSRVVSYLASILFSVVWINSSLAAPPSNITGTWSAISNQTTGALVITQVASTARCKPIVGTIFGTDIEGHYCPNIGQVTFIRTSAAGGGVPIQFYRGVLASDGTVDRIGGTFFIWNCDGGCGAPTDGVEYNFSATK